MFSEIFLDAGIFTVKFCNNNGNYETTQPLK